ncbi:actin-related protein 4 [Babesia caballi]|uniref:Actin-related protein 4 n=1 Tax=Babesia caballi TaxID=5871 RepID=A0AAV4M4F8_BABCB|nr:actin-related protein 4 [Babesia caballi]
MATGGKMEESQSPAVEAGVYEDVSEPGDAGASSDEEVSVEELVSSIMKGVSKAFLTTTANKSRGAVKSVEKNAVKPIKRASRVSIRAIPDEASEINERRHKKIANNGGEYMLFFLSESCSNTAF